MNFRQRSRSICTKRLKCYSLITRRTIVGSIYYQVLAEKRASGRRLSSRGSGNEWRIKKELRGRIRTRHIDCIETKKRRQRVASVASLWLVTALRNKDREFVGKKETTPRFCIISTDWCLSIVRTIFDCSFVRSLPFIRRPCNSIDAVISFESISRNDLTVQTSTTSSA